MKSRNAENNYLILFTLAILFCGCGNLRYNPAKNHTFQYILVTKNGKTVFPVEKGDTMNVNSDGSFNYFIKQPGKTAQGKWRLLQPDSNRKHQAFEFRYSKDNQVRIFEICRYNRNTLILCEGPMRFEYKRIR